MKSTLKTLIAFGLLTSVVFILVGSMGGAIQAKAGLEARVKSLETMQQDLVTRIGTLERRLGVANGSSPVKKNREPKINLDRTIVSVKITNKRFQDIDAQRMILEQAIFWDCEFRGDGLTKTARAIKGHLVFADLFDEVKARVSWTIEDPVGPDYSTMERGRGIGYNQFIASNKWLKTTELKNMHVWFEVDQVIYQDGSSESF